MVGDTRPTRKEKDMADIIDDFVKGMVKARAKRMCVECGRVFDMLDEADAEEWNYGHDCEA